jgi:prevent-host-death family protein
MMTMVEVGMTSTEAINPTKTVAAGKFKAQCLALLDEVEAKRMPIVVTKNGRAVARVVPMPLVEEDPIFGFYKGKLEISGDILSPIYSDEELEEFFERSAAQLK